MRSSPYLQSVFFKDKHDFPHSDYPFDIPAVGDMESIQFHPNVTFFVGENGSGKSTVLEAIALAMGFNPEGGSKNAMFETAETTSSLHTQITLSRIMPKPKSGYFLRAESFFNVATYLDQVGGNRSLHQCSHGEAFISLLTETFTGDGIYLLDEPEAALSPQRQLAAICAINKLASEGAQFIIATHSPILLAYPHAQIFSFSSSGIQAIDYEDTEHFQITRNFLNNHVRQISLLID